MVLRTRFLSTVAALGVLAIATGARTVQAQSPLVVNAAPIPTPVIGSFGGTQVAFGSAAFSSGTFAVNLLSAAYSGGTSATGLDFYYQLQVVNNITAEAITNLSLSQFSEFLNIAAGQTTTDIDGAGVFSSGTVASSTMSRTSTALSFDYNSPGSFTTGAATQTLVVRTNTTAFTTGTATVTGNTVGTLNSGLGGTIIVADTPEPGTLSLLGMGLASGSAGVAVRRRRRIAKK